MFKFIFSVKYVFCNRVYNLVYYLLHYIKVLFSENVGSSLLFFGENL